MTLESDLTDFSTFCVAGTEDQISCHIVVKESGEVDISQMFSGVLFPSLLLVKRGDSLCTTGLAIITALQRHLASRSITIHPTIFQILNRSHPRASNILVATTRVPDFSEGSYRNFENAFRQLGGLWSLSSMVPKPEFDDSADVMAVIESSKIEAFFSGWNPMNVTPKTHFIVIFLIQSEPLVPSIQLPSTYEMFSSGLPSSYIATPLPDVSGFLSSSATSSVTGSTSRSSGSPSRSSGGHSRSPSPGPYPAPRPLSKSRKADITELCRSLVSDFETLEPKARWAAGTRTTCLATLARSFYALEQIVIRLTLDPGNLRASQSFTLDSGESIVLTTEDILGAFDWKGATFTNKRTMYKSAKSVALRTWKAGNQANSETTRMHEIFLGIKYLWAENGPLADFDAAPLPSSEADGAEKFAANLHQSDLGEKCKKLLRSYTE